MKRKSTPIDPKNLRVPFGEVPANALIMDVGDLGDAFDFMMKIERTRRTHGDDDNVRYFPEGGSSWCARNIKVWLKEDWEEAILASEWTSAEEKETALCAARECTNWDYDPSLDCVLASSIEN